MRRIVAVAGAILFVLGVIGASPASATHCKQDSSISTCPSPVTVLFVEGVGQVCNAVSAKIEDPGWKIRNKFPGYNCTYFYDDPSFVTKSVSPWGSKADQGLYWPGLGPGGEGPTVFDVLRQNDPPRQACVSSVGGAGCSLHSEGLLEYGHATGNRKTGAHCGSSHGTITTRFTAADGSLKTWATLTWDQSAATILPQFGVIDRSEDSKGNVIPNPSGQKPTAIGFVSARGVGGSGNCGVSQATTGFQVEGVSIIY